MREHCFSFLVMHFSKDKIILLLTALSCRAPEPAPSSGQQNVFNLVPAFQNRRLQTSSLADLVSDIPFTVQTVAWYLMGIRPLAIGLALGAMNAIVCRLTRRGN